MTPKRVGTISIFLFKNKDAIIVECYNWSENVPWKDHLRVRITTNEFLNFLQKE